MGLFIRLLDEDKPAHAMLHFPRGNNYTGIKWLFYSAMMGSPLATACSTLTLLPANIHVIILDPFQNEWSDMSELPGCDPPPAF